MTGENSAYLIYGLVMLVFIASSLFSRKIPLRDGVHFALIWIAIFGAAIVAFSYKRPIYAAWQEMTARFGGASMTVSNGNLVLGKSLDGHFHANAELNGHRIDFLVDSGATTTTITADAARAANVEVSESGFPVVLQTANGTTSARRARIAELRVGPVARDDFPILVSETLGDTNLLGMDFLSSLNGWRVEKDQMILNP